MAILQNFSIFEIKQTTMFKTIFYIAIGGAIGSVLRYLTSVFVNKYWANQFPLATLLTNVLGCLIIGFLIGILEKNNLATSNLKWFLITGFCGGYTTFSNFGYENYSLLQSNNSLLAFGYIALSILLGIFAVWLGLSLAK
jgi:CrcB protein